MDGESSPLAVYTLRIDEPVELRHNRYWRTAVWALRVGYLALIVAAVGLIVVVSGSTPWILACGVILWLVAAVATATCFMRARQDLPEPRPGFWSIRSMLLHDTVHARPPA